MNHYSFNNRTVYRDSKILNQKRVNPLHAGSFTVTSTAITNSEDADIYHQVWRFFVQWLRMEYEEKKNWSNKNNPLSDISASDAIDQLRVQFISFIAGKPPFHIAMSKTETPLHWWRQYNKIANAEILAVTIIYSHYFTVPLT
jgi:hypothetical protein